MNAKISNLSEIASLRRYTLTDGKGAGLDVIDCDNGKIRFLLNVSCALDIMQLYHEGQNMSFLSKNAFTSGAVPFESRFEGGMLYTCGLESVGGRDGYETHGSLHKTPAEIVRSECTEEGITVEAIIRSSALFGKNLALHRRIFTAQGSECVTVEDVLKNEAYTDENYSLLYHVNLGYPMLDAGAEIVADLAKCEPRNEWAKKNRDTVFTIEEPTPAREETCYFLSLRKPEISLVNKKLGKKFTLSYSGDTLPKFVEWKSMASGDFALGLEPATTELDGRFEYKNLSAGESVVFSLKLCVSKLV